EYINNIVACNTLANSNLFRPPYGRIGIKQIQHLRNYYKIIMWDVLSGDFDIAQTPESCADNVIQHAEAGSIVVFHDSEKAKQNVLGALPVVLKYFSEKRFIFNPLPKTMNEFN
ncbi:MAG TPA: polysaccharide deacetylase family protein, partial [Chitinophagales bacterium]|nr:polysaccharide deacetylase family protein [Chitinophagales bacterium]